MHMGNYSLLQQLSWPVSPSQQLAGYASETDPPLRWGHNQLPITGCCACETKVVASISEIHIVSWGIRGAASCAIPCYVVLPQYLNTTTTTLWGCTNTCDVRNLVILTSSESLVCCIVAIRGTDNLGLQRQPPAQPTACLKCHLQLPKRIQLHSVSALRSWTHGAADVCLPGPC
jgi:hypothetical protein